MSSANDDPTELQPVKKVRVKAWHIVFLAVLVVCTWALAWWQWTRFQSGSGTFQNLGYAFQWPFFGLFFVFAYRKILAYESEKLAFEAEQQKDTGSGDSATPQVPPTSRGAQGATGASPQFIDESFLPQREQLSVEEFNRLNQPRRRKGDSQ